MFCFHALQWWFFFSTNQRVHCSAVLWDFERLDLGSSAFFGGFAFIVLHLCDAGPSRRRGEQANLYGLCFAISPETNCELRTHISETYPSIGRIEAAKQWLSTAAFGCSETSK